uniref:Uncharacterized protein n=1 Tax=Bos indicus x Bos taurus TaxID=30522 RepID=A0A4W2C7G7_BOBOX
ISIITKILLSSTVPELPVPHAQIHSKPLQEQLRTVDVTTGLTSCFLFPPAWRWALNYVEHYKHIGELIKYGTYLMQKQDVVL